MVGFRDDEHRVFDVFLHHFFREGNLADLTFEFSKIIAVHYSLGFLQNLALDPLFQAK